MPARNINDGQEAASSIGLQCDKLGLSKENVLQKLKNLKPMDIQNGHVFEIFQYIHSSKGKVKWKDVHDSFKSVYPEVEDVSDTALRNSFEKVKLQRAKHLQHGTNVHEYLAQLFVPPKQKQSTGKRCQMTPTPLQVDEPLPKKPRMVGLKEEVQKDVTAKLAKENNDLTRKIENLLQENKDLRSHCAVLNRENIALKDQLRTLKPSTSRHNQKVDRLKKSREHWKGKFLNLKSASTDVVKLQKKFRKTKVIASSVKKLQSSKKEMSKRHKNSKKNLKCKLEKKFTNYTNDMSSEMTAKQKELKKAETEVRVLENECVELSEELESSRRDVLQAKKDGKTYSKEVREACYVLQTYGVAQVNVPKACSQVYHALTGKEIEGPLPQYTSQNNFVKEMKSLARQRVKEVLAGEQSTTLKYDGTTKALGHLVETEVSTKDQTFLVGLALQTGGTAAEYMNTIAKTCERVDETLTRADDSGPSQGILQTVQNTMTDRCITNSAIDNLLETKLNRELNRFKCALHPLDSIAKECEKAIKKFEEEQDIDSKKKGSFPFLHRGESNTQALARVTSKLFHDTQYNCCTELTSYLKSRGTIPREDCNKSVLYYRFVGNRFHIYFLCSSLLFHYHRDIIDFFADNFPPVNQIQTSVLNALQLPELRISLRALGIVAKVVTGPWMRLIGETSNILQMNEHFQHAYEQLRVWSDDASPLMCQDAPSAFREIPIKKDKVFDSLVAERSDDLVTKQLLQELLKGCVSVMDRQLKTQLPGGQFWNPSAELVYQAQSCSNTNISGERNFALADYEIHRAPAAKPGYVEGKVMFRVNKVHEWLDEKPSDQKEEIIRLARLESRKVKQQEAEDQRVHRNKVSEKLRMARARKLEEEDKERKKVEKWLEEVFCSGGLWNTEELMDTNLNGMGKKRRMDILKSQLNVRIKVLKCVPTRKVFLSKCSIEELKELLLEIMKMPVPPELQDVNEPINDPEETLVGCSFSQRWDPDGEDGENIPRWYTGEIVSCYVTERGHLDFKVIYDGNSQPNYLAPEEIIVDILRGDFEIFTH